MIHVAIDSAFAGLQLNFCDLRERYQRTRTGRQRRVADGSGPLRVSGEKRTVTS
jgi:hypothetical protein